MINTLRSIDQPAPSLLLLPAPPPIISIESIYDAYLKSIIETLAELKKLLYPSELVVAVGWPVQYDETTDELFEKVLKLLGYIYLALNHDYADSGDDVSLKIAVNFSVILLDYTQSDRRSKFQVSLSGPVVQLESIVRRRWEMVFSGEDAESKALLEDFLNLKSSMGRNYLDGGLPQMGMSNLAHPALPFSSQNAVAVGGTFDHLHAGHKLLLTAAALLLKPLIDSQVHQKLIIGITGQELLQEKKYVDHMESWSDRQEAVVEFLLSILLFINGDRDRVVKTFTDGEAGSESHVVRTVIESLLIDIECVEIHDAFGPTITNESLTALVVSEETRSGGQEINVKRAEKGWRPLEIYEVPVLELPQKKTDDEIKTKDFAYKISSTDVRKRLQEMSRYSRY